VRSKLIESNTCSPSCQARQRTPHKSNPSAAGSLTRPTNCNAPPQRLQCKVTNYRNRDRKLISANKHLTTQELVELTRYHYHRTWEQKRYHDGALDHCICEQINERQAPILSAMMGRQKIDHAGNVQIGAGCSPCRNLVNRQRFALLADEGAYVLGDGGAFGSGFMAIML
jgi:hypothetical protein